MKSRAITVLIGFVCLLVGVAPGLAQVKTLKIGSTMPLNNPMGIEAKKCYEVLVEEFNRAGGLTVKGEKYNIDMIIYDDKYRPEVGRAAVERLVNEDKVRFMVGQLASASVQGGLPVTEGAKVLTFASAASTRIVEPPHQYTYRFWGAGGTNWIYLLRQYPNAKSMVSFAWDDETGRYVSSTQETVAKAYGIKVLSPVFFPRQTVDFAPFATKIKTMNPDVVSTWGSASGTQLGLQYKALYTAGWRGIKTGSEFKEDEVMSVAPKEAIEGFTFKYNDRTQLPNPPPPAVAVKNAYVKKYGKWDPTGLSWCTPWFAFLAAVKKADSLDTEALRAAMPGLEFVGIDGRMVMMKRPDFNMNRYCDVLKEEHIGVIKDGKVTYGGTVSIEETKAFIEKVLGHKGEWGF